MGRTITRVAAATAATWRRGRVDRRGDAGPLHTRWLASSVRPRFREIATCVRGRGRFARPVGRRNSSSELDCGSSWWGDGNNLADRTMARKKRSEVRDHAAVQVLIFRRAGTGTWLAGGELVRAWACWALTLWSWRRLACRPGAVPAVQLALAIRMLTVALVVTTRPVFACAPVAQTQRSAGGAAARSRLAAVISRTLASAHGRFDLPRESSGRVCNHSPRALSKREQRKRSRYSSARAEPDKERNNVRNSP